MFYVETIGLEDIMAIWKSHLWLGRISAIESTSCIEYGSYPYLYNSGYSKVKPDCFGVFSDGNLVGVNSGHITTNSYRSRGLFVFPQYRRMGIGSLLLRHTVEVSKLNGCDFCWSMPRKEALNTYELVGFTQTSDFFGTETSGENCFVINYGK